MGESQNQPFQRWFNELPSRAVVRFYNKRGTAEQWIKEGKLAVSWTRLSCHRFRGNEALLWLSVIPPCGTISVAG